MVSGFTVNDYTITDYTDIVNGVACNQLGITVEKHSMFKPNLISPYNVTFSPLFMY